MKRLTLAVALAVVSMLGFAMSPSTAGQVCHAVQVTVNGQDAVTDAGCTDLP